MAYPPTVPSNARANGTAQFDNHPADHNAISNALTDVLSELGTAPKGAFASVTARVANLIRAASGSTAQLVQSGTVSAATNSNGDLSVVFGEAFTSGVQVVVSFYNSGDIVNVAVLRSVSTTGFTVRIYNTSGSAIASQTRAFHWMAMGTKT